MFGVKARHLTSPSPVTLTQIFLDWSHATAHNGCYSIHPSQNFTNFPSNVDDNDLQEGNPVVSKPMDVHTDTSFTICRLKFVALYRELVDVSVLPVLN